MAGERWGSGGSPWLNHSKEARLPDVFPLLLLFFLNIFLGPYLSFQVLAYVIISEHVPLNAVLSCGDF